MILTQENLEHELDLNGITLVDFFAPWCQPCKMMNPILDKITTAKVIKVNTEDFEELTKLHDVKGLPTFKFYKNGVLVKTIVGATPKPTLEKIIAEISEM